MAINFNKAEFVLSSVKAETFIRDGKPQVTFAGRSNVGKSSVINRLLGRKNFARVGATPGKTSQINYFSIDGKIYFTDLPGYGYAKVSKEERDRWGRLMERYFAEEGLITLGVLIVDARHKPTADDVTMCDWFKGTGCPVIVVANKLDKLKKSQVEPALDLIREGYRVALVTDCIDSRDPLNKERTILRLAQEGVVITTYESVLYELLGSAKAPEFKAISAIVK